MIIRTGKRNIVVAFSYGVSLIRQEEEKEKQFVKERVEWRFFGNFSEFVDLFFFF